MEREQRAQLEQWAAVCIQALARGYLCRPAKPALEVKQSPSKLREPHAENEPFDPETLRAQLYHLTAETDLYMQLVGAARQPSSCESP